MFSTLLLVLLFVYFLYYIYTGISDMNSRETMKTITVDTPINLKVVRFELDFSSLLKKPEEEKKVKKIRVPKITINRRKKSLIPPPPLFKNNQKRDTKELVEELLDELYADHRDWNSHSGADYSRGSTSIPSLASSHSIYGETEAIERSYLESLDIKELRDQASEGALKLQRAGERLVKSVRTRDRLRRHQKKLCGAFSVLLRHISGVSGARFSVSPSGGEGPGEGGYAEWHQAMRLVARLPAGVPQHFRRKLWLTLAERHLTARGVDWPAAERACFRGTAQPDDTELGAQIIKDLHRTGCSLFCGAEGRENQAMLRRVLLAYARWNKDVGYCQGFNMLAAIILEVMDKSESDSLKVMLYLVEAVLPEGYFADDLRGLSADMAAFRDLLRLRLPRLAHHMDYLQKISDGGGVEPPLPDVFTMQWFLTLYATWLPRDCLLRIWDLVLLDGNEVLLLTALAIWDLLQDRILSARSADEFYSCMGGGAGVVWEAGEALVARVVAFGAAPELPRLRSLHRYRVAPPAPPAHPPIHTAMQSMTKRGLRLFYSEDEGDSSDDGNKMALATVMPRRESRSGAGDRLSLDIGALKRQYARLRERQRQAHVILAAACARHAAVGVPTSPTSLTVNNLLLGKSAIVSSRGRRLGPPPGAVPPSRQSRSHEKTELSLRVRSTDTISWHEEKSKKTLSRRNSVKWKDIKKEKLTKVRKASIDFDETGDGTIVSEIEANEMIASLRSRSSSETSSYSSRTNSSTDTSLCDENARGSDSETDLPNDDNENKNVSVRKSKLPVSPGIKDIKAPHTSILKETAISTSSSFNKLIDTKPSSVKDITDYLDSAAGEPLRTYIDEFEAKLKNNVTMNETSECFNYDDKTYKPKSDYDPKIESVSTLTPLSVSKLDTLISPNKITYSFYDDNLLMSHRSPSPETTHIVTSPRVPHTTRLIPQEACIASPSTTLENFGRTIDLPTLPISPNVISPAQSIKETGVFNRLNFGNKTDNEYVQSENSPRMSIYLSPVDLTPNNCDFLSNLKSPLHRTHFSNMRPPDIIDSFTMYPNFVPDIDLSDNNSPDIRSSPQSPDEESIIVSEDEPPIPLKIDKYFEHSPEFFGARVTDPNNADIPSRRSTRRVSRIPKKPDSLTLQSSHGDNIIKEVVERASSLPQSHSFTKKLSCEDEIENEIFRPIKQKSPISSSPQDFIVESGRKNSEIALQIIQENSKILKRILTKQNILENATNNAIKTEVLAEKPRQFGRTFIETVSESKAIESPLLKESTSDSLIGCRKRNVSNETIDSHDFTRVRPISIDDPFSLEARNILPIMEDLPKNIKSPSIDCLGNKTDTYGWENKGFLAKCDSSPFIEKPSKNIDFEYKRNTIHVPSHEEHTADLKPTITSDWSRHSFSGESKTSVTLPSSEPKETSAYGRRFTSEDCNYPLTSKYNDYVLSEASDICRKTVNQLPKICDNLLKTDDSQASDFAHVVTSSISFTYEPSIDDDSPTGAISNSSDTLCQITSLDQVSTPISPKLFSVRDTPTLPKDNIEKSDTVKLESDDTCSAITSLLETDTLSSLSYPRSPSTGSYHPFPTRPLRNPKELGVKLGMYPKDNINSAPK